MLRRITRSLPSWIWETGRSVRSIRAGSTWCWKIPLPMLPEQQEICGKQMWLSCDMLCFPMVTIQPMNRKFKYNFSATAQRFPTDPTAADGGSTYYCRTAMRTMMFRAVQTDFNSILRIFYLLLLKSTDLLCIVKNDRHCLPPTVFVGHLTIGGNSGLFQLRLSVFYIFLLIPVTNRRWTIFLHFFMVGAFTNLTSLLL